MSQSEGAFRFLGGLQTAGPLAPPGEPASLVFWIALILALWITGAYSRHRGVNALVRLAMAALLAAAVAAVPLAALEGLRPASAQLSAIAVVAFVMLAAARSISEWFLRAVWPRDRGAASAILIGPADVSRSRIAAAVTSGSGDYRLAAHLETGKTSLAEATKFADGIGRMIQTTGAEAVILAESLPDRHLRAIVDQALSARCVVLCPPEAVDIEGLLPRLIWHHDQPLLEFGAPVLRLSALVTKRITDVVGGLALLIVAAPLMALIAIGLKFDSPGPVFFVQDRVGRGGRRFRMLKFRTMRIGADAEKEQLAHLNHTGDVRLFKIRSDPRVTRFGKFLRRWSLDELPQFWNVVRGDMSLVGPRPFFESDFAAYEEHHFRRLDTKPGITGLWQVGGRSEVVDFEDVVYLDRQYIERWSFWLDLSILLRTIPSVLRRTGAY